MDQHPYEAPKGQPAGRLSPVFWCGIGLAIAGTAAKVSLLIAYRSVSAAQLIALMPPARWALLKSAMIPAIVLGVIVASVAFFRPRQRA